MELLGPHICYKAFVLLPLLNQDIPVLDSQLGS